MQITSTNRVAVEPGGANFYLTLCEEAETSLAGGSDQVKWLSHLNEEWRNIQAAFSTFADAQIASLAMALKTPNFIHSSRRSREVVSETTRPQRQSASSQEHPVTSRTSLTWKQSRSEARWR
jgi:hypothetical protein